VFVCSAMPGYENSWVFVVEGSQQLIHPNGNLKQTL